MTGRPIPPIVLASLATLLTLHGPARAGGPIGSGEIRAGIVDAPGYVETWTFAGAAGERVLIGAVSQGPSANTAITLKRPNGTVAGTSSGADRLEYRLDAAGGWTIEVSDLGLNDAGSYVVSLVNLGSGPWTTPTDPHGGAIASGTSVSGSIESAADLDAYTFQALAGDRVFLSAVTTSPGFDTHMTLYPPAGFPQVVSATTDRIEHVVTQSGTWSVAVEDVGWDATGDYRFSLLVFPSGSLTSAADPDGGALLQAEPRTGTFQVAGDFDAWTFDADAGDRVLVWSRTLAGSHQAGSNIYGPGGAPVTASLITSQWLVTVPTSGTHAIVVEESGLDQTGSYLVSAFNLTAGGFATPGDPDGGTLASGAVANAAFQVATDADAYQFSATAGDRLRLRASPLSGAATPSMMLVSPSGAITQATTALDYTATSSGLHSVVVSDAGNNETGTYALSYWNLTTGPLTTPEDLDGGPVGSAEERAARLNLPGDFDVFTVQTAAGDRVALRTTATSGTPTFRMILYPPGGIAPLVAGNRADLVVSETGTWLVLIEDAQGDDAGDYVFSFLNVTSGPLQTPTDPDGGAIASNDVRIGTVGSASDIDAFTFAGTAGQRIAIARTPHGDGNPLATLTLYGPSTSTVVVGSRLEYRLVQTGLHTLLVEPGIATGDPGYTISFMNLTAGPFTGTGDTGGPIGDGIEVAGAITARGEFDAYRFSAPQFTTVVIDAVALGGTLDTKLSIYPPTGGPASYSGTADHVEFQALTSGTYTLLVEDATGAGTGEYRLSFEGGNSPVGVETPAAPALALAAPYPNPSSGETRIECAIPSERHVRLRVYDARGAVVRTLADARFEAGPIGLRWDGRNDRGARVAAGLYFVELRAGDDTLRRKLVRIE